MSHQTVTNRFSSILIRCLLLVIFLRIFVAGFLPSTRSAANSVGLFVVLILSTMLIARLRSDSTKIIFHPVLYLPPLFLAILFLDLAIDPLAQVEVALNELFRILSYTLVFITLTSYLCFLPDIRQIEMLKLVTNWAAYLAISLAVFGVFKFLQGDSFVLSSGYGETAQSNNFASGLAVNPNAFGALLTMTISGVMLAPTSIVKSWLKYTALLLAVIAIVLSGSRTAILAIALAFSAQASRRPKYLLSLLLILGIAAALVTTQAVEIGVKSNTSISWRWLTWSQLLGDMGLQEYLIGKGPGEVERFLTSRYLWVVSEPHNDYLRMLYFYGIGGLVYFSIVLRPKPVLRWRKQIADQLNPVVLAFLALSLAENIYRDSNATLVAIVWLAFRNGLARTRATEKP